VLFQPRGGFLFAESGRRRAEPLQNFGRLFPGGIPHGIGHPLLSCVFWTRHKLKAPYELHAHPGSSKQNLPGLPFIHRHL
jgi:hypothetical protein